MAEKYTRTEGVHSRITETAEPNKTPKSNAIIVALLAAIWVVFAKR